MIAFRPRPYLVLVALTACSGSPGSQASPDAAAPALPVDAGRDASPEAAMDAGHEHDASGPDGAILVPDAATPSPRIVAYTGSGATRGRAADRGAIAIGHQFSVTREGIVLHDVGVWDHEADGLARAQRLTLFRLDQLGPDAMGVVVAGGSAEVPAGEAAELEDGFRFVSLAKPLALEPGHYALVAYDMNAEDAYGNGGSWPVRTTGVLHGTFSPYQFAEVDAGTLPQGGGDNPLSSVSFRYTNGELPPLRILPMGDSITWGAQGTDAGYRAALARLLTERGASFQFVGTGSENPGSLPTELDHHEGHRGWVISKESSGREGLLDHVSTWLGKTGVRPDVVLLMIGTNDVHVDYELDRAEERLDQLLSEIQHLTPDVTIVLAQVVPVDNVTKDARARTYNEAVTRVAVRRREAGERVLLVDMHGALDVASDLADELHPNDAGYDKMARVWFDALVSLPALQ